MKLLKGIFVFLILSGTGFAPSQAQAATQPSLLMVEQGTHRLKRESGPLARVAVGDPAIADVNIINRRELLITGKTLGVTSLMVWPAAKGARAVEYRIKVTVVKDPTKQTVPDAELRGAQIDAGKTLEGRLPNLMAHRRAKQQALNAKDVVQDRSDINMQTQVMTEVKVAEISRTALQSFGFQFFKNSGNTTAGLGATGGVSSVLPEGGGFTINPSTGYVPPIQNAFQLLGGNAVRSFLGMLSIMEGKGIVRVLAEPSLVAMSGQTATYLAGGEFPVPVTQGGVSGGITIEYKEFGVRLSLSPTVLSRDRISLKVAPEVSDLDFSAGVQVGGVSVPALTVRRTDTTVELGDGESFVISGLISSSMSNNVDKVPWLGNIPVIGAFFRSTAYSKTDKELVMIVTPRLVRPVARGTALPKLPGAKFDKYDPSFAETMLLESGDFETGFSK